MATDQLRKIIRSMKFKRLYSLLFVALMLASVPFVAEAGSRSKKKAKTTQTTGNRSQSTVQQAKKNKQAQIRQTEAEIKASRAEAARRLSQLNLLSGQINDCTADIARLNASIDSVSGIMTVVNDSIDQLESRLGSLKESYGRTLRRQRARRRTMSDMAFLFSSSSLNQAMRRSRLLKQQARWQSQKVADLKETKAALDARNVRLAQLKEANELSLHRVADQRDTLKTKQAATSLLVDSLKTQESALNAVLATQRQEARDLDNELSRLIAEEQARQERLRREAEEAARKAAAEEAARKAAEEEAARKAAAEEQAKKEADADKKSESAKTDESTDTKQADKKQDTKTQETKTQETKQSKTERKSAKHKKDKKKKGNKSTEPSTPAAQTPAEPTPAPAPAPVIADAATLTETFANAQGRMPWPVSGKHVVVKQFGVRPHPHLPHVTTDNPGIDIETDKGATVKCIFDGEVSVVCAPAGYNNVIVVRHGDYFTVYANLGSVSVHTGDKVKAGTPLGKVHKDPGDNDRSVLHFEVRLRQSKQDPETWLK